MTEPLFIGVDGGGSHTRARLRDASGALLGEGEAGPGNARLPGAFDEILKACRMACRAGGVDEAEMAHVHAGFGLAGTQQDPDLWHVLAQPYPFASLTVDTDAYAAWLGAFGGEDGAIMILGTGSCGLAFIGDDRLTIGGWGAEIADEGSGANMGRLAIRRSIWAYEGMMPKTAFADAIMADFDGDPQNATLWSGTAKPADYAAFAPRTFDYAEQGDELAQGVARDTGADASMLIERLVELGATQVATIGGLYPRIIRWLTPAAQAPLTEPRSDATDGAVLMARRAYKGIGTGRPMPPDQDGK